MIFKQLFDPTSSTFTYLIGCEKSKQCLLIDSVFEMMQRDLELVESLQLTLIATLETHIHADHITAAYLLKQKTNSKIYYPKTKLINCADEFISEDLDIKIGEISLKPIFTPGHTDLDYCFYIKDQNPGMLLTGDCLLINGCGRTDFQSGDPVSLYNSIHNKLFTLDDDTIIYPGHDYNGLTHSTLGYEKERNPRLNINIKLAEFVTIMNELNATMPKLIDIAVPANQRCGHN